MNSQLRDALQLLRESAQFGELYSERRREWLERRNKLLGLPVVRPDLDNIFDNERVEK